MTDAGGTNNAAHFPNICPETPNIGTKTPRRCVLGPIGP